MRIQLATIMGLLVLGFAAGAQEVGFEAVPIPDREVCEPPISTCRGPQLSSALLSTIRPDIQRCPSGYECVCVPSCPTCDDCDAEVCVRDRDPECRTACDCPTGLGCFEGQCIAGVAPVYCCDSDRCPAGEMCQGRDGEFGRCFDPMCQERVHKVTKLIASWVERTNRCEVASDCVQIGTSTQCRGTCGEYVNEKYAGRVQRLIHRLDQRVCDTYQEDGCPFATPACQATRPACVHNRCTGAPVRPGPGPFPRPIDKTVIQRPGVSVDLEPQRR